MNKIEEKYLKVQEKQSQSLPYDKELNELIVSLESSMIKIIADMSITDTTLKEDLMQEGRLSVCKAVAAYTTNNNTTFYTFVYQCIKNGMLDYLRGLSTKKNMQIAQAVSLDNINEDEIADDGSSLDDLFDDDAKLKTLFSKLDDIQKKIVAMRIENYSYEDIAKALNKNTKYVDNAIQKIKKIYKSI